MPQHSLRIAFVIPWYGRDLVGGAELYCYHLSQTVAKYAEEVHVITTCCKSFHDDWSVNFYPESQEPEDGVLVLRFPVDPRNAARFDQANGELMKLNASCKTPHRNFFSEASAHSFEVDNVQSRALLTYLVKNYEYYDAFVFMPYLYGPILLGLPLVRDKAYLIPCLHDETYAYLPSVAKIFSAARGIFFISEGEAKIGEKIFGPAITAKSQVIGGGIDIDQSLQALMPKLLQEMGNRFLLCLGRKDNTKNTGLALEAFDAAVMKGIDADVTLVLAGPGSLESIDYKTRNPGRVIDLGLVSEEEKRWLLMNCLLLLQPSRNESFSRVMMEAWFFRKAVIVHSQCLATASAVMHCQGGWVADSSDDWAQSLMDTTKKVHASERLGCGERGFRYVEAFASWDETAKRILSEIEVGLAREEALEGPSFHQVITGFSVGDAVSQHALILRKILVSLGYRPKIFAIHIDPKAKNINFVRGWNAIYGEQYVGLIYHHSTYFPHLKYLKDRECLTKIWVYHNVTPAAYFAPFSWERIQEMRRGRRQLEAIREVFDQTVCVSEYNAADLRKLGYQDVKVIPLAVDVSRWNAPPDRGVVEKYQDNYLNILFVGRLAPNKCQHDLIKLLSEVRKSKPYTRLILAGYFEEWEPYYHYLLKTAREHGVEKHLVFTGHITDAELSAYYLSASVFVSMSEHEGFCVPVLEALQFDLPVLAFAAPAIVEVTAGTVEIFQEKNFPDVAAKLFKVLQAGSRNKGARARLESFSLENLVRRWQSLTWQEMRVSETIEAYVEPKTLPPVTDLRLRIL